MDGRAPAAAARGDGGFPRSGDAGLALGAGDAILRGAAPDRARHAARGGEGSRHGPGPAARSGVLRAVAEAAGPLQKPAAHATTDTLRARFGVLVRPDQRDRVLAWCDWADTVLMADGRTVLVHGDFHGDNHLWDSETLRLRLVIDLETVGTGEPEFDLRCLPGDCGIELFTATVAHYEKLTGTKLDVDRIMAWHLRTVLGDALWRSEAGIPLPDKRTPVQWVDDLTARFTALGTFD
jgi:hypothetical protein